MTEIKENEEINKCKLKVFMIYEKIINHIVLAKE